MAEYETSAVDGRPIVATEPPVIVRRGNGSGWILFLLFLIAMGVAVFAFGLVRVDQTSSGSLPKVETSGGSLPSFSVDTAKVDVGTRTKSVGGVPDVTVGTKQKTVEVPTIHVEPTGSPNDKN